MGRIDNNNSFNTSQAEKRETKFYFQARGKIHGPLKLREFQRLRNLKHLGYEINAEGKYVRTKS